jgi:hypothetical protein
VMGVMFTLEFLSALTTLTRDSDSPVALVLVAVSTKGADAPGLRAILKTPSSPTVSLVPTSVPRLSITLTTAPVKAAPVAAIPDNVMLVCVPPPPQPIKLNASALTVVSRNLRVLFGKKIGI